MFDLQALSHAKRLSFGTAMVSLYLIGSPVRAQLEVKADTAAQPPPADEPVLVVTGTRASQASAISRKKNSGTVSDSIVAEDVGKFPDKNVGEALSRITGVQLSRDFGEGVQVSIRGVEPGLNRVEINGQSLLGTSGDGSRGADFRELQSELIQSIDVFKGFTADMTEGAVGGTVSIKTRKPLDFKKPTYALTVSGQQLSLDEEWTPRISVFATRKFLDNRLGVLFNATYDDVNTRQDYVRNTEWVRLADFDNALEKTVTSTDAQYAAVTSKAACATTAFTGSDAAGTRRTSAICQQQWWDYNPRTPRYGIWTRNDKRLSAELSLQYRISDKFDVWGSFNKNERHQTLNDRNWGTAFTSAGLITKNTDGSYPVTVDARHNVIGYTANSTASFSTSSRDFELDVDSQYASFGGNYRGERLRLEFLGSFAKSTYEDETNNVSLAFNVPGLKVSLDPATGAPSFIFPAAYDPNTINTYTSLSVQYRPSENKITEDQFKIDADYDLNHGFFTMLEVGVQGRKSTNVRYRDSGYTASTGSNLSSAADDITVPNSTINYNVTVGANETTTPGSAGTINSADYTWTAAYFYNVLGKTTSQSPTTFYRGYDIAGLPANWLIPDTAAARAYFDTSHFNHDTLTQAVGSDGKLYPQIPTSDVSEKVIAGYVKLNFASTVLGRELNGNFGWRAIGTTIDSAGLLKRQEKRATPTTTNPLATTTYVISNKIVSIHDTYQDILPSFNVSLWLIPDQLTTRLGFAKVLARPKVTDLAPGATCTFDVTGLNVDPGEEPGTCSGGNPHLKPYRANQYDFSTEWYPNRDTQLSFGAYYKNVQSYILSSTLVTNVDYFGDGHLVDVSMPINGAGAQLKGFEVTGKTALTFLPGVFSGLGVEANYTFSTAGKVGLYSQIDGTPLPFPGLSRHSYNATLWYDKGPINARLAYQTRTRYLTSAAERSGNPVFRDGSEYLDGKVSYEVRKGVTLFVEGKNLTGTAERSTAGGDNTRLNELAWPGKRYFVGVTYKH